MSKAFSLSSPGDRLVEVETPTQRCRKVSESSTRWLRPAIWKGSGQKPGSSLPGFERSSCFELILRHFSQVLLLVLQ